MIFDLNDLLETATDNVYLSSITERSKRVENRIIDTSPYKILDAPGLIDDYYLNLLDWSENRITIALGGSVYCYNTDSKEVDEVYTSQEGYISCISGSINKLYIGESSGKISVLDLEKKAISRTINTHSTRVCSISVNDKIISSGSKDGVISNEDIRSNTTASSFTGHTQEVCGLKWSCNKELLASGSNDNTVRIWKMGSPIPKILKGHESAIKALDWCPWKSNVLTTGGGTKDKTIRFWDTVTGKTVRSVTVNSQVCTLNYLSKYKEIVTSHGYVENDLRIWKASGMKLVSSFGSHDSRVLHTAISPDQCSMVSLGADESLKFWKIAEKAPEASKRDSIGLR